MLGAEAARGEQRCQLVGAIIQGGIVQPCVAHDDGGGIRRECGHLLERFGKRHIRQGEVVGVPVDHHALAFARSKQIQLPCRALVLRGTSIQDTLQPLRYRFDTRRIKQVGVVVDASFQAPILACLETEYQLEILVRESRIADLKQHLRERAVIRVRIGQQGFRERPQSQVATRGDGCPVPLHGMGGQLGERCRRNRWEPYQATPSLLVDTKHDVLAGP